MVEWSIHAKQRFFERSLMHGINYGDVEKNVLEQKVKQMQKEGKIKTIFCIEDKFFTVIKAENRNSLGVISIWESNEEEVNLWKKKK